MMEVEAGVTQEMIFNAILTDRSGLGIRSRYPRYYVWNGDKLYLVGSISVMNMGVCNSHIRRFNEVVGKLLNKQEISYLIQDISAHSSRMAPINSYTEYTPEGVWKGMESTKGLKARARKKGE